MTFPDKRRCLNCAYYSPQFYNESPFPATGSGLCKRRSPSYGTTGGGAYWPLVRTDYWCGEWEGGSWDKPDSGDEKHG